MSCCKKSWTGCRESAFGVALKYSAPLKKCLAVSVTKNCLDVAALPPTLKKTPDIFCDVLKTLSLIELAITSFLLVSVKASFTILSKKFDTFILSTSPWLNTTAASDKFAWVQAHLGDVAYKRLILSHHKHLNSGDYLIDDRPNNGADKFIGELIQFGSGTFPIWKVVTHYLLSKVENF